MATKKAAKKATKKPAKKTAAKKAAPKKAAAKTAAPKKVAAKKAAPKKSAPKKSAPKKSAPKKAITPRKALSNTRKLLEAKQQQARETPAWQQIGSAGGKGEVGFQSPEAAEKAQELHEAEIRLEGNQGSISTRDRHAQGRRDSR